MNRRWLLRLVPFALAGAFVLWRYVSPANQFTNPETGERHRVALSTEQELALGAQAFQDVLRQSQVVASGPEVDQVRRVAARLTKVTGEGGSKMEWKAAVIRDAQANAFCLPGGKIAVFTGILPVCADDAGLAAVLGHEMAHATARHGAQRLFQQQQTQALMTGASFSLGDLDYNSQRAVMGVLGAGAQYGVLLPFSRDHESEADRIGVIYMARAGYDPRAAIAFWQRMGSQGGKKQAEFASTHPSHGTRISALEAQMPEALEVWRQAGGGAAVRETGGAR